MTLRNAVGDLASEDTLASVADGIARGGAAVPKGYFQIPVTGSASAFLTPPTDAVAVVIQPNVDVRWRDDGTNPTSSLGMTAFAGGEFVYAGSLVAIRFIAVTIDGVLDVSYYA